MEGGGYPDMEARHISFQEDIGGMSATMVRPREGEDGLRGMVLKMPTRTIAFRADGLSREQQEAVLTILRSLRR